MGNIIFEDNERFQMKATWFVRLKFYKLIHQNKPWRRFSENSIKNKTNEVLNVYSKPSLFCLL